MATSLHTTEGDIQREMISLAEKQGWEFILRTEMNELRGKARMSEGIVEPLLVAAIRALNPWLDDEGTREVAARVRRIGSDREMLEVLRDGVPYKAAPDQPTRDALIVDRDDPTRNRYVVTEEFAVQTGGQREPRLDVVFLVNGIPLGAFENKDTSEQLGSAAGDWRGYWSDAPQLVAQISVAGCCTGLHAVVGPSGLEDIDGYREWTNAWPRAVDDDGDPMLVTLAGAFHPHTLVDLAVNFVVFETREGVTRKKLAHAHQYRAANKIVARVRNGELDRGIVWHATGSGKSLTMVFAARKLIRTGLGSPTVLIVIDRTELDEQISETLTACKFDGVERATSRRHLEALLGARTGGVVVTTMHKFDDAMAGLLDRREVITFVDEAHRTQFGRFGIWMRKALPRASLFGFTGTPIEKDSRSTRAAFSPLLRDGTYESYLDRYGFEEAIADGATVHLIYESRLAEWQLTSPDLDQRLGELTPGLTDEERDVLREQATRESVVANAPARVAAVASDIVAQMRQRIGPLGLVGQVVTVDREACALLAEQLSEHLEPDEFAVIMSRLKKDSAPRAGDVDLRRWYAAAQWERVHGNTPTAEDGGEQETEDGFVAATDRAAIKDFIARFKREGDPLCLLVVNNMLLTGFDAPNEGALFLDRGLSGHTLMQAINRPNRRYRNKEAGIIFDYWGLFSNLGVALAEFSSEDVVGMVEDSGLLVERFPAVLDEAMELVANAPGESPRRRMLWLVRRFTADSAAAERFEALVREAQSIFEILSPDPRLADNLGRYTELLELWTAWTRGTRRDQRGRDDLRHKTRKLVQEAIGFKRIREDLPAATIDAHFLSTLKDDGDELPAEDKATDIEAAIEHEIKVRGEDDPRVKTLAERLADLRARQEREAQMTLASLAEWEGLVRDHVAEKERAEELGLPPAGAVALAVLRRAGTSVGDEVLVETARGIGDAFDAIAGFHGWSGRADVIQGLQKASVRQLAERPETRPLAMRPDVIKELLAGLSTLDR
jgi:type I restriction enzyme R subunit